MVSRFDALIIGGGPGGLSIGSLLAREGLKSAIVEKGPVVGGRYRAMDFHGCHVDNGVHLMAGMVSSPDDSHLCKLLSFLGIPVEAKVVPWTMGIVSNDNPDRISYFSTDPKRGVDGVFDFIALCGGAPTEDSTRKALTKALGIMEATSEEECRRLVNLSIADWIDKNVEDPMANTVLLVASDLLGAAAKDYNCGQFTNVLGAFPRTGGPLLWYPTHGSMEDTVIAPLAKYYTDRQGKVLANRTAREILIEDGEVRGVVVHNNETLLLEEYTAPVVISAIPIFEAVARNILRTEFLTEDWAEAIRQCANLAHEDASGFYLLREEVIPKEEPGWLHIFDVDYGVPTFVGDWNLASTNNAVEPQGKQLLCSYIPGCLEDTHFGLTSPMKNVREANRRFKDAVEKAFPGFMESIEFEGLTLQLSSGRYAWAVVPTEIDIQSPNIEGLYFQGDSIRSVAGLNSDKVYQMAFPLCERIMRYLGP
jgi:hypothetical protein